MFNSETKLYGIFGDPIKGSLSPEIHNYLFTQYHFNGIYLAFHVPREGLKKAVLGARSLGIQGFNITIPHKERILDSLDGLDLKANQIGAVNTVKRVGDQLIGYNTDIVGFLVAFKDHFGVDLKGKRGAVLGSGGSARAIVYGLLEEGFSSILLFNRTLKRANRLIEDLIMNFQGVAMETHPLTEASLLKVLSQIDFLINTLPENAIRENPWILSSLEKAPKSLNFYDTNYRERMPFLGTKGKRQINPSSIFVEKARSLNLNAIGGLSMLVAQAVESFEIWTDHRADWKKVLNSVAVGRRK